MVPNHDESKLRAIESRIGIHPDFPKKGILFRDVTPIFDDPILIDSLIDIMCDRLQDLGIDRILGIESRGCWFAPLIARKLGKPFCPVRKKGKLPGEVFSMTYDLEYGSDTIEIQKERLPRGSKCVIIDDLLATGGTMEAAKKLVLQSGSDVIAALVVIELVELGGQTKLGDTKFISLFKY